MTNLNKTVYHRLTPTRIFKINCLLAKEILAERIDASLSQINIEKLAHYITQIELNKKEKTLRGLNRC